MRKDVFLGFRFYGSGNIGDDLMMAGFFSDEKVRGYSFLGHSQYNLKALRKRCPSTLWNYGSASRRLQSMDSCKMWLGVGDTPFQVTSGDWFIDEINADIALLKSKKMAMAMIGVGAESEASKCSEKIKTIINKMDFIVTRDVESMDILNSISTTNKIFPGGDLANIALQNIFGGSNPSNTSLRDIDLGINFYAENHPDASNRAIREFAILTQEKIKIQFFANETRKREKFEYYFYKKMFHNSLFSRFFGKHPRFYIPPYNSGNLYQLIQHFKRYKVVASSRYHALLTAAWAGCRVIALGRSGKIATLARQLGIPIINHPFDVDSLQQRVLNEAIEVSGNTLNSIFTQTKNGIEFFTQQMNKYK